MNEGASGAGAFRARGHVNVGMGSEAVTNRGRPAVGKWRRLPFVTVVHHLGPLMGFQQCPTEGRG